MHYRKWGWHWPIASFTVLVGLVAAGCTSGLPQHMYPGAGPGYPGAGPGYPGMNGPMAMNPGMGGQPGLPGYPGVQQNPAGMQAHAGMQANMPGGTHQAMRPMMPGGNPGATPNGIQPVGYQPNTGTLPYPMTSEPTSTMPMNGMPMNGMPMGNGGIKGMPMTPMTQGGAPTTMLPAGPTITPLPMYGQPPGMHQGPIMSHGSMAGSGPMPGPGPMPMEGPPPLPRELTKSVMPPYTLEPPDTIFVDVIRAIPKPPYRIEPLDVLVVNVAETLPNQPINGTFLVSPDGLINLGYAYGVVRVAGLTLEQAAAAVRLILRSKLNDPQVGVGLAQFRGTATLRGEFMLAMDGTITLGSYGCVQLAGLTVSQAKAMIEKHLSQWLMNPEVSVSVTGYNSKVYYIVTDGGGFGQNVYRMPITGNETVLDALAQVNGLPNISSKRRIWLARPAPACKGCYQILPIHWEVITQAGATETNWQLFPGDRIFVGADPWIEFDNKVAKIMAPIERLLGITLLGASTIQTFRNINGGNNNGGGGAVVVPAF